MPRINEERGTELIWQGKYNEEDKVNLPQRVSWPFQTIETVNESKVDRENLQNDFFNRKREAGPWRNRLIWGDNKYIMSSLLKEFAGKINLIYIDPPFATGADFSYKVDVGEQEVFKKPSMIEEVAYRDTWGKGMDSYLQMMFERLVLMRELLADNGSIYVHLDWRVGHYIKLAMDEVFGKDNFRNQIIWHYMSGGVPETNFARKHGTILFFSKTEKNIFNVQHGGSYRTQGMNYDEQGRPYKTTKKGRLYFNKEGPVLTDVWTDIPIISTYGDERVDYPTQKPEKLCERIIKASSNEGAIVADFFCGSGTTGVAAEKLGRQWIMADLSRFAIQTTRKRLLQIGNCSPFVVQNLGKYERQYWYSTFGSESAEGKRKEYQETILNFYKAEPVKGYQFIHGSKGQRVVHVGELDVPVTLDQVDDIIKECLKAKQGKVDVLGWEFEMGLDVEVENRNKTSPVKVRLLRIPKEVMDPKYEGKIEFYDLGSLDLDVELKGGNVEIVAKSFYIPHLELVKEEEVREKIKHWQDFIDYWSIDWNYRDDTFHNEWQEFRTKQNPKLKLKANSKESSSNGSEYYKKPGKYKILVKVIDIFGNDTTRLFEVNIK